MSGGIEVTASLLSGGVTTLKNLKNIRILSSLDSPAESLSAWFAPPEPPPPLGEIKVYEDERLLFSGWTDCQEGAISEDGILTRIDARSAGALMLDNQALPCVMQGAQIAAVFNRFIAPYGFSLYNPNRAVYLPMYTVRAGMSEWDAFINFTRRVYGVTPYVKNTQVMVGRPSSQNPLVISNNGEGVPYTSLKHIRTPYSILSKVILRDQNGRYSAAVHNSAAAYTNTLRKRYVIPPSEYVDRLSLDGNQRIRRSMFESEQITAVLPGVIIAAPGDDVIIRDKFIRLNNMMVISREYIVGENGVVTKLTLKSSVYYD